MELLQQVSRLEQGCLGPPSAGAATADADADARLVAETQAGSRAAFDVLVERHRTRMFHLACRMVGPEDADDVTQEVFIAAYRSLPGFRGQARFSTWLYRIALNVCSRTLKSVTARTRRERPSLPPSFYDCPDESAEIPDTRDNPEELALRAELQECVRHAIAGLPDKQRAVVLLRDMEQLSYQEIAEVLGCPIGTVRSRLHHATAELARRLRSYWEG